jgi:N-acetylmuramoyl-L-alanine amidase
VRLDGAAGWRNVGLLTVGLALIVVGVAQMQGGDDTDPVDAASRDRDASETTTTTDGTSTSDAESSSSSSVPPEVNAPATTAQPAEPQPVVVIDPGHNGANGSNPTEINRPVDAGGFQKACNTTGTSTDGGYSESRFNWEVAQLVRERLEDAGIRVVLTRDGDDGVGPCIDERGQIAARNGAAALVSIHADGAPAGASGFHVIHPGLRPGYTDATVEPSTALATALRDTLVAADFSPSSYVGSGGLDQRDDLGTLNRAEVPAVMLEAGNMRNPTDAAWITSDDGRRRLATAIADALVAWLGT